MNFNVLVEMGPVMMLGMAMMMSVMVGQYGVLAYSRGPPVGNQHPDLCSDMMPGHGVSAQPQSTLPFEIDVSGACYNDSTTHTGRDQLNSIQFNILHFNLHETE